MDRMPTAALLLVVGCFYFPAAGLIVAVAWVLRRKHGHFIVHDALLPVVPFAAWCATVRITGMKGFNNVILEPVLLVAMLAGASLVRSLSGSAGHERRRAAIALAVTAAMAFVMGLAVPCLDSAPG